MKQGKRYRRKPSSFVTAVQLDLDTDGFSYRKWGGLQHCKPGDWLVNNDGDTYTVDQVSFASSYAPVSPGVYCKIKPVWAYVAEEDGSIATAEGETRYRAGDYVVCNDEAGTDCYAVSRERFESLYEPDEAE